MRHHSQETAPSLYVQAAKDAFRKLDPRVLVRNPVMFVVAVGCVFTTASFFSRVVTGADAGFSGQISLWLWFTVLFANFAEALAEGRGKAQADTLRRMHAAALSVRGDAIAAQGVTGPAFGEALRKARIAAIAATKGEAAT